MIEGERRAEGENRICKKCLIREMAGQQNVYETIRRMIEDIPQGDRAVETERERRLNVCKQCERLLEGMCAACGCYVELRASLTAQSCPYDLW